MNQTLANGQVFLCHDLANTTIPQSKVCNFVRDCPAPYLDEANCGMWNLLCLWSVIVMVCAVYWPVWTLLCLWWEVITVCAVCYSMWSLLCLWWEVVMVFAVYYSMWSLLWLWPVVITVFAVWRKWCFLKRSFCCKWWAVLECAIIALMTYSFICYFSR